MTFDRSDGVLAIAPALSKSGFAGCTAVISIVPTVAFIAYKAARVAGWHIDPSVSVPIDTGANPAATPAALPDDEPHGVYSKALFSVMWTTGSEEARSYTMS